MRSLLLVGLLPGAQAQANCRATALDFVVLAGDATQRVVEDDIRRDLAEVGIDVTARYLEKEAFNAAMVAGDFNMVFSETWGAPYDPHSYVASWSAPDEAHYAALSTLDAPMDRETFPELVANVSGEADAVERQRQWTYILSAVHAEVLHLPMWGKRIPSVATRARVENYLPGFQQFDYPLQRVRVVEGSKTITVAPGAQTGLFQSVGLLEPHGYRPNEFFSNNWIYEGLVGYGPNGEIEPALATSWRTETKDDGGELVRFVLRENVKFHDGAAFNCSVVKLNFDHVFAPPLREPLWHGWYSLPGSLSDWYCEDDDFTFVLETRDYYYPLLQELTYIRPMRILSPLGFADGLATSPLSANSCPAAWGTVASSSSSSSGDDSSSLEVVNCTGARSTAGTGPFRFVSRDTDPITGYDESVVFARNDDYWGAAPDVEAVVVKRYESHAAVKAALLDGDLDMVLGAGVLDPKDVEELRVARADDFEVLYGEPVQNTVVILNAAKAPTDDIDVRKVIVHAVNKNPVIENELGKIEQPVSQLFPITAPYCDVHLLPQFDYDFEKATLLNCPAPAEAATTSSSAKKKKTSGTDVLFVALFSAAAALAVFLVAGVLFMAKRERAGAPLFSPLLNKADHPDDDDQKHQNIEFAQVAKA
eukprot:CAMPEP_0118897868 /NCGR_PEP_ID=MMETSP1166-20130328/5092_1 /TAXON_ID=1104430 /ORGANISM="Chrysoreinhardia sp, Strain CCMP3193" /LENGTH=648 /DNA_ID=CAMNT_0006836947 /DNA_START=52 /DNA_END=1998 /DNA_ORIENTATION=+